MAFFFGIRLGQGRLNALEQPSFPQTSTLTHRTIFAVGHDGKMPVTLKLNLRRS